MNKNKIVKAMPTVLFAVGIVGIFVSETMCARDTLKAEKVLYEKNFKLPDEPTCYADNRVTVTLVADEKEKIIEEVKATWKCYIPTVISTTLTLSALITSNRLTTRQVALLSSAVASTGGLVTKYRKAILDRTDEEVLHQIDREVASATMEEAKPPVVNTSGLLSCESFDLNEEDGEFLFFDPLTKMKFRTTKLAVLGAKYYLNRNLSIGLSAPLSMFYGFLGLELPYEFTNFGWDLDQMAENGYMWADIDVVRSNGPDPDTGEYYYILEYDFPGMTDDMEESYFPFGNPLNKEGSLPA